MPENERMVFKPVPIRYIFVHKLKAMKEIETITIEELSTMAESLYGDFVKAVVDVGSGILVVDAELHVDEEAYLLGKGSLQEHLWGINLYPLKYGTADFIEFDSMINIRPRQQNRSRNVEDEATRNLISELVQKKIKG